MGLQDFQILQPLGKGAFASVVKVRRGSATLVYSLPLGTALNPQVLAALTANISWLAFYACPQVMRISDNKIYALKRVNIESMSQKEVEDTLNEIRFLASFKHPRLVRFYETFLGEHRKEK